VTEPSASEVLSVLNGFIMHGGEGHIRMNCSFRQPVPPGAPKPKKCTWSDAWGTSTVGVPIRLMMDSAVEHMASAHGT
jgi:hypothetical protein